MEYYQQQKIQESERDAVLANRLFIQEEATVAYIQVVQVKGKLYLSVESIRECLIEVYKNGGSEESRQTVETIIELAEKVAEQNGIR